MNQTEKIDLLDSLNKRLTKYIKLKDEFNILWDTETESLHGPIKTEKIIVNINNDIFHVIPERFEEFLDIHIEKHQLMLSTIEERKLNIQDFSDLFNLLTVRSQQCCTESSPTKMTIIMGVLDNAKKHN